MDLSDAYANAAYIPGAAEFPARWAEQTAQLRAEMADRITPLRYGATGRQEVILLGPERASPSAGCLFLVHGGYWRAFSPEDFLWMARGALERGWSVAMPGYDLCPDVRLPEITAQVAAALGVVAGATEGPLHLAGHSAGGHLVARVACPDVELVEGVRERIRRIVPISPLSDLRPLMQTDINADLRLSEAEAETESPVNHPAPAVPVHVWVGAEERPAFLDQARWLAEAWGSALTIEPGRHHFDVIEGLEREAPLLAACLEP